MEWKFSEFSKIRETDKSLGMNSGQFKDPLCYQCLIGSVLKSG